MKPIEPILLGLVLVLTACLPVQTERLADVITGPVATATILETSTMGTMAPPAEDQLHEPGERVEFEPGVTSTTRSGALTEGGSKEYVLSGASGQSIYIETVGYDAPVYFNLRSPVDESWSGEPQASDVYISAAQVSLPKDGDYVMRLSVPSGATRYDVTFTMVGGWLPAKQPERVEFAPGTSSIEYSSILPSGLSIKQYVLAAKEGQIMTVNFVSEDVPVSLSITSPSGLQLFTEGNQTSPTDGGYRAGDSFTLAETGDYLVMLIKAEHTPSTNYKVEITLQ